MFATRFYLLAMLLLTLAVQGCATPPGAAGDAAPAADGTAAAEARAPQAESPELTLNLPERTVVEYLPEQADYTFLDKGVAALVTGEHVEAVTYFQRYQRLESSPAADWESAIAIAFDSMLPGSPFYDPAAARNAWLELVPARPVGVALHPSVLLMSSALATLVSMQDEVSELQADNALLAEDLEKREAAIKRLRALTLGQKEAPP